MNVTFTLTDKALPTINALVATLDESGMKDLNEVGARAARQGAIDYHHKFDRQGKWQNRGLPTWGTGRKRTHWGNTITLGWKSGRVTSEGFSIMNRVVGYRLKVSGGVVRKRGKLMTIPNVPEAHGRTVAEYERRFGPMFFVRGKNALWLAQNKGGEMRVIYWLAHQTTHKPVRGALPSATSILTPALKAMGDEILSALDGI